MKSAPRHRESVPTPVYLECGSRRVFAGAVDWPGWCRSGKTEELALEALAAYAARYAPVAQRAGVRFPAHAAASFDVVERLPGNATTDFGAPGAVPGRDAAPLTKKQADRLAALVGATWEVFDAVAAGAPATLRKGPRGGGRDRDQIVAHVTEAEEAYARQLGLRRRPVTRDDILDAIRSRPEGTKWPVRYAARRIAWHVLDHAWEIEDRSA
jgi:hypothetical protein